MPVRRTSYALTLDLCTLLPNHSMCVLRLVTLQNIEWWETAVPMTLRQEPSQYCHITPGRLLSLRGLWQIVLRNSVYSIGEGGYPGQKPYHKRRVEWAPWRDAHETTLLLSGMSLGFHPLPWQHQLPLQRKEPLLWCDLTVLIKSSVPASAEWTKAVHTVT